MFSPSLVCGINVCLVQLQDMHDMQENVRQSNLQLGFFSDYRRGNWKLDISEAFFSKPSSTTRVKILGINKPYEDGTVNIFKNIYISESFSVIVPEIDENRCFCHLRKTCLTNLTIYL